jgi:hypothetical protein
MMIDITVGEMFLLMWAIAATVIAYEYRKTARERHRMLQAAALLTKRVVEDDRVRDDLRATFRMIDNAEKKFGMEK